MHFGRYFNKSDKINTLIIITYARIDNCNSLLNGLSDYVSIDYKKNVFVLICLVFLYMNTIIPTLN